MFTPGKPRPSGIYQEGLILDNNLMIWVVLWLGQHPFGAATMVYAASVFGVLLYAYFEPRDLI
jgi:hypothetical protein